jgi:hypothetical protein
VYLGSILVGNHTLWMPLYFTLFGVAFAAFMLCAMGQRVVVVCCSFEATT